VTDEIYVECSIDGPLETVWDRTQEPARHERWDLRVSEMEYVDEDRARVGNPVGSRIGPESGSDSPSTGPASSRSR